MKNTKILTVLAVIMAMGLAGCKSNNKSSSTEPSKSSNPPSSQSSQGGQSSGGGNSSSSQQPAGYVAPVHHWSSADTDPHVDKDAEKGTVAYWIRSCTDHAGEKGIEIAAKDGTLVDNGKLKVDSNFPDYVKLDKTGSGPAGGAIEYKFEYDSYAQGTIFQRAIMDYWHDGNNENQDKGYYNGSGGMTEDGNFKLEVNGKAVDFSKMKDVTYADLLPEEKNEKGSNMSQLGDCEIGEISLVKGLNTIKYTRLNSYNMLIKDFVLAVKDIEEWGPAQDVAADATAGTVAYKKFASKVDSRVKIEVQLADSMLAEGSVNKNDPEGYMKLKEKDQSFGFKFNYGAAALGYVYQRGVMDNWNTNNKYLQLFSSGKTDGTGADDFEMKVNNEVVDLTAQKFKTYDKVMPGEEQDGHLSPLTDVLTGVVALKSGVNEFSYTRKASYNLALTHIVFIFVESAHTHTAATEWSHDDNYHYHGCTDADCPVAADYRSGSEKHAWVADESKTSVEATCLQEGIKYEKCSVCGLTREVPLAKKAHTWVEGTAVKNTDEKDVIPLTCSTENCTACGAKMSYKDFSACSDTNITSSSSSISMADNNSLTYKMVVANAGTFKFEMCAKYGSGNSGSKLVDNGHYSVTVDGTEVAVNSATYSAMGLSSSGTKQFTFVPEMTLTAGEHTIVINQGAATTAVLAFKNNVFLYQID